MNPFFLEEPGVREWTFSPTYYPNTERGYPTISNLTYGGYENTTPDWATLTCTSVPHIPPLLRIHSGVPSGLGHLSTEIFLTFSVVTNEERTPVSFPVHSCVRPPRGRRSPSREWCGRDDCGTRT